MDNGNQLFLGKQLAQDLFNHHGVLVAPAHTVLDQEQLDLIYRHAIELEERDIKRDKGKSKAQGKMDGCTLYMAELFEQIRYAKQIPVLQIREKIIPSINELSEIPDFYELLGALQSKDDYSYRHNIGVGVLSTLIGKWMDMDERDLMQLTMAGTLHDIGKTKIPNEILNKPGSLDTKEFDLMKKHTIFGYELLKDTVGINHVQALVALQHHERQDGSGYPLGLRSEQIAPLSKIVAVADVFHAMTSDRPYRKALPFYETLIQMNKNIFGEFDPQISKLFMDKMMQSMLGHQVLLTNNEIGSIVLINPQNALRPLVKMNDNFIDLSRDTSLHILKVAP
ncbi:HD-GYP domain-containing protein [Paenibacillus sp. FSL H8-0537]|uniref:HD-GYP domain-containing protein n=1 Tax=Paenibacillus sp. FSL H8-0537 TaxID=2921399 RepID=UPI003101058E